MLVDDDVGSQLLTQRSSQSSSDLRDVSPTKFMWVAALMASLSSILLGYDIGIMSGAIELIEQSEGYTDTQKEVIMGSMNLVAPIGAIVAGKLSDNFGRRNGVAFGAVCFIAGSLLMASARMFGMLLLGRIVVGLGVGGGIVVAPLYVSELCPPGARGRFVSFAEISINAGILLGYIVALLLHNELPLETGWRWMLGAGAAPGCVILLMLLLLPESPYYLVSKGELRQAEASMQRTHRCDAVTLQTALDKAAADVLQRQRAESSFKWKDILCPRTRVLRHIVLLGCGIGILQQACGSEAIVYYTPAILKRAGLESLDARLRANLVVGLAKTLTILVATFTADHYFGRRRLLLISTTMCSVSLLALSLCFWLELPVLALLSSMSLFMIGFSVGLGPVVWMLLSEIFPLEIRGRAMSLATSLNRVTSGLVAITFLSLSKGLGDGNAFFFYFWIGVLSVLFVLRLVPETRGKSFPQILRLLRYIALGKCDVHGHRKTNKRSARPASPVETAVPLNAHGRPARSLASDFTSTTEHESEHVDDFDSDDDGGSVHEARTLASIDAVTGMFVIAADESNEDS
ncbi:MAG: hypothetical protein MHM6MM_000362 [Cercozoa sp. M6MM]